METVEALLSARTPMDFGYFRVRLAGGQRTVTLSACSLSSHEYPCSENGSTSTFHNEQVMYISFTEIKVILNVKSQKCIFCTPLLIYSTISPVLSGKV